jgi:NTE family protein
MTKKALVLSGGGGRGAFQAGAIAGLVEAGWLEDGRGPDYIAGTSIGAVHAAALASGKTVAELEHFWTHDLSTERVHQLEGPWYLRLPVFLVMGGMLSPDRLADDPGAVLSGPELPDDPGGLLGWLARRTRDALLHETHLMTSNWPAALAPLNLDFDRINNPSAPQIVVTATDIQTGAPVGFSNRTTTLSIDHLEASASIQTLYQPKQLAGRWYWDGAVTNNTPLDPLLTLIGTEEVEIVTILMSPWRGDDDGEMPPPTNLYGSLSLTLDWMLLGSYHAAVKRLTDRFRPGPRVIAPDAGFWHDSLNLDRLLLYDPEHSAFLFEAGRQRALNRIR